MSLPIRVFGPPLCALFLSISSASADEQIDLSPRTKPAGLTQVSIDLEVGGSTIVRVEREGNLGPEQPLPMSVSAKLRYAERRVTSERAVEGGKTILAVRYYDSAEAVIKVDEGGLAPRLADDRRTIVVESSGLRPTLYCADGALTREQLDLLDVVGSSTILEQLLPPEPVGDGDAWAAEPPVMAALLTLDSIAVCEVQSVLEEFNSSFAKVRLAGVVHGTAEGAATEQEVRGVYLFDRRLGQITRLNLAVREQRSIGGATPGLDAVAKLQLKIEPLEKSPHLDDQAIAAVMRSGRRPARDLVYEAPTLGFQLQHDRQWFITSEQREVITLRRVDGSDLVAQCSLSALPPKSAGRQSTLEQFQKDVAYSLGKNFGALVSTRQWQNAHGHYCYEVVVRGKVEELPVEWHYYLVGRESGHRVSLAVTIEGPMVGRVAGADRALVERLQLFPPMPAAQTAARDIEKAAK